MYAFDGLYSIAFVRASSIGMPKDMSNTNSLKKILDFVFNFETLSSEFISAVPLSKLSNKCLMEYNKSDSSNAFLEFNCIVGINLIRLNVNAKVIKNTNMDGAKDNLLNNNNAMERPVINPETTKLKTKQIFENRSNV